MTAKPAAPTPRTEEEVIGDELCRTSFGDFSEATMRRIAARIARSIEAEARATGSGGLDVTALSDDDLFFLRAAVAKEGQRRYAARLQATESEEEG